MTLVLYSMKNARVGWWRSLILGVFIFFISFIMVFFNSFSSTLRANMQDALIDGLTGHLQLRSARADEDDMVDFMKQRWEGTAFLPAGLARKLEDALRAQFPEIRVVPRVRHNGLLVSDLEKEPTMIVGIDPAHTAYHRAIVLGQGRFLQPGRKGELVITERLARRLRVSPGDTLGVLSMTRDDIPVDAGLTVAGIGNFRMLSLFDYTAVYTDIETARTLAGFGRDELSDILLYVPRKGKTADYARRIRATLERLGIAVSAGKRPAGAQPGVCVPTEGRERAEAGAADGVRLSVHTEMGGFFTGVVRGILWVFYCLVALFMLVISLLIHNLVYMMGIERYREIGTLRAIGFNTWQVTRIFVTEILSITALFGFIGLVLGSAVCLVFAARGMPSFSPSMDFIMGRRLFFRFEAGNILAAAAILFLVPLAAALRPALKACSLRPGDALKETAWSGGAT